MLLLTPDRVQGLRAGLLGAVAYAGFTTLLMLLLAGLFHPLTLAHSLLGTLLFIAYDKLDPDHPTSPPPEAETP